MTDRIKGFVVLSNQIRSGHLIFLREHMDYELEQLCREHDESPEFINEERFDKLTEILTGEEVKLYLGI